MATLGVAASFDRRGSTMQRKSPLLEAALYGDTDKLRDILGSKGDDKAVSEVGPQGVTALHLAAAMGHLECVRFLLDKGADVTAQDDDGRLPLTRACAGGKVEVARLLYENGPPALINRQARTNGWTPLHYAASAGHRDMCAWLISLESVAYFKDKEGRTPDDLATAAGLEALAQLLSGHGSKVRVETGIDTPDLKFQHPQTGPFPVVTAGTVGRLTRQLAEHADFDFMKTFLLTYRSFSTPQCVFDTLRTVYDAAAEDEAALLSLPSTTETTTALGRMLNVMAVLQMWTSAAKHLDPGIFTDREVLAEMDALAASVPQEKSPDEDSAWDKIRAAANVVRRQIGSRDDESTMPASPVSLQRSRAPSLDVPTSPVVLGSSPPLSPTRMGPVMRVALFETKEVTNISVRSDMTYADVQRTVCTKRNLDPSRYSLRLADVGGEVCPADVLGVPPPATLSLCPIIARGPPPGVAPPISPSQRQTSLSVDSLETIGAEDESPGSSEPTSPRAGRMNEFDPADFVDAALTAGQITAMDQASFAAIAPKECLGQAWSKNPAVAPNIVALTKRFNQVSAWVVELILGAQTPRRRSKSIEKVIDLAQRFMDLNNFHGVTQVLAALKNACISRMKRSWALVSDQHLERFEKLQIVISPADNRAGYRALLSTCNPPCLPYIGVYLSDLVFVDEGNPSTISDPACPEPLVNFTKYRRMANLIEDIRKYQHVRYKTTVDPTVVRFFESYPVLNEDAAYQRSLALEPRERSDRLSLGCDDRPAQKKTGRAKAKSLSIVRDIARQIPAMLVNASPKSARKAMMNVQGQSAPIASPSPTSPMSNGQFTFTGDDGRLSPRPALVPEDDEAEAECEPREGIELPRKRAASANSRVSM